MSIQSFLHDSVIVDLLLPQKIVLPSFLESLHGIGFILLYTKGNFNAQKTRFQILRFAALKPVTERNTEKYNAI
jgi:hypothetical protein